MRNQTGNKTGFQNKSRTTDGGRDTVLMCIFNHLSIKVGAAASRVLWWGYMFHIKVMYCVLK